MHIFRPFTELDSLLNISQEDVYMIIECAPALDGDIEYFIRTISISYNDVAYLSDKLLDECYNNCVVVKRQNSLYRKLFHKEILVQNMHDLQNSLNVF